MNLFDAIIRTILCESLDGGYDFNDDFEEYTGDPEDYEDGYPKEELAPVQMIHFSTDDGVNYIWYARQGRYTDTHWEIAFGEVKGKNRKGGFDLDISTNGRGNALRVFATAIEITNNFIEFGGERVMSFDFTAKEENRKNLYIKRFVPLIDDTFELDRVDGERITMQRTHL